MSSITSIKNTLLSYQFRGEGNKVFETSVTEIIPGMYQVRTVGTDSTRETRTTGGLVFLMMKNDFETVTGIDFHGLEPEHEEEVAFQRYVTEIETNHENERITVKYNPRTGKTILSITTLLRLPQAA
jgi:hypothetical protein